MDNISDFVGNDEVVAVGSSGGSNFQNSPGALFTTKLLRSIRSGDNYSVEILGNGGAPCEVAIDRGNTQYANTNNTKYANTNNHDVEYGNSSYSM